MGPTAAPGWYPDPDQVETQRYWDGAAWTDQRAPLSTSAPQATRSLPIGAWIAGVGILAIVVGVFLPYGDSKTFSRVVDNSLIQHTEGVILIILALVAALAVYRNLNGDGWRSSVAILGVVCLGLAILVGANMPELHSAISTDGLTLNQQLEVDLLRETASPGIGIYVVALGGLLLTVGGIQLWRRPAT